MTVAGQQCNAVAKHQNEYLGQWRQAVGCTGGVRDNVHTTALIFLLIYTHHKHGSIGRRRRDDNLHNTRMGEMQVWQHMSSKDHVRGCGF